MTGPDPSTPASAAQPRAQRAAGERSKDWTVLDLLRWTTTHFAEHGIENPRLDAECLLAHALGIGRLDLYLQFDRPVDPGERAAFRELVTRRGRERVPVSVLIGRKEFWSLPLQVTGDVLTPRPETETLVAAALALFERDAPVSVLEIGTGSGAVALALAHERPQWTLAASDVSAAALAVARANAESLGLAGRIEWFEGSLYAPVSGRRFDLVISNPPYVSEAQRPGLPPELAHEPDLALFGGAEGLDLIAPLIAGAPEHLTPGGALAFEHSPGQAEWIQAACREAGSQQLRQHPDLGGRLRVTTARFPGDARGGG